MSEHTPGPWEAVRGFNFIGVRRTVRSGNAPFFMASVNTTLIECESRKAEAEANFRLIAAAPELLEALENLERVSGIASMQDDSARVAARVAIAKAKGENQ